MAGLGSKHGGARIQGWRGSDPSIAGLGSKDGGDRIQAWRARIQVFGSVAPVTAHVMKTPVRLAISFALEETQ